MSYRIVLVAITLTLGSILIHLGSGNFLNCNEHAYQTPVEAAKKVDQETLPKVSSGLSDSPSVIFNFIPGEECEEEEKNKDSKKREVQSNLLAAVYLNPQPRVTNFKSDTRFNTYPHQVPLFLVYGVFRL